MFWLKEVQDAQIREGKIKEPSGVPVLFCDELIIKDTIHIDDPKQNRRK